MKTQTTFPNHAEFEKAKLCMEKLSLAYEIISPGIAYEKVGNRSQGINKYFF